MKNRLIFQVLAFVCICLLMPTLVLAGTNPDTCGLFTRADAEGLFGQTVSDGISRTTTFPAGESCRYSFTEKGDSYGFTVKISTTEAISKEGINDSAADLMARQKKARKTGYAAKTFRSVQGLGDDAFWNGNDLWVLAGDTLVIISVHSVLAGSFKDISSARTAREEQDLSLSKKVAQTLLPRLK